MSNHLEALKKIAAIKIDDDEEDYPHPDTGEKEYVWLSHVDAHDYLFKAVNIAREALKVVS